MLRWKRIEYRGIVVVRKTIKTNTQELEKQRKESIIVGKFSGHRHIIGLVGTYKNDPFYNLTITTCLLLPDIASSHFQLQFATRDFEKLLHICEKNKPHIS